MKKRSASDYENAGITAGNFADILTAYVNGASCTCSELLSDATPDDFGSIYTLLLAENRKTLSKSTVYGKKVKSADVATLTAVYTPKNVAEMMAKAAFDGISEEKKKNPATISAIDIACGSGELLLFVYRELRKLYLGKIETEEIPRHIFRDNLRGCDIDKNAVRIAAIALLVEGRKDDASLTVSDVEKAIVSLSDTKDETLSTVGSLWIPATGDTSRVARLLTAKYDIIVLNPPYMGRRSLPPKLADYMSEFFPMGKFELYASFLLRSIDMLKQGGVLSFLSVHTWMFLTSFAKIREKILKEKTVLSVYHLGAGIFTGISAYNVLSSVLILRNEKPCAGNEISFYTDDFEIPFRTLKQNVFFDYAGAPFLYTLSDDAYRTLSESVPLGKLYPPRQGLATGDNDRFVRYWFEPEPSHVGFGYAGIDEAKESGKRWFPYNKGGNFRKFYGMNEFVVDFHDGGRAIYENVTEKGKPRSRVQNAGYYFRSGITWSLFGFKNFSVRYKDDGYIFDVSGSSLFAPPEDIFYILAFLSSSTAFYFLSATAPTVNFQVGNIAALPYLFPTEEEKERIGNLARRAVLLARQDWDSTEISFDFRVPSMLKPEKQPFLSALASYLSEVRERAAGIRNVEEEINRFFIRKYRLENEVTPCVPEENRTIRELSEKDVAEQLFSYFVLSEVGRYNGTESPLYTATVRPIPESELPERFRTFLEKYFTDNVEDSLADFENVLGMNTEIYVRKHFYSYHDRVYRHHPILYRLRDGHGGRIYFPVHRTADALANASGLFSEDIEKTLFPLLKTLSPDDGYEKNAEKLHAFLV